MTIPVKYQVSNLTQALELRQFPTVTVWNRLEGRPRRDDFSRALKAELRDATWMITRQWQIGEFEADDAGSPVFAKIRMRTSSVTKYQAAGGTTEAFDPSVPMEAKAEQRVLQWRWNGHDMHYDLRAQLGRHWRKLLAADAPGYADLYLAKYPIVVPPRDDAGDRVLAHRQGWQQVAALAGRVIDGGALYSYLVADPSHHASDGITLAVLGDAAILDTLGGELVTWFQRAYMQPTQDAAWKPEYLEYKFACSVPRNGGEVVLDADDYAQGHVDWYSFDRRAGALDGTGATSDEAVAVRPFIPAPIAFEGMPDPRWWALEDRKTDFGAVKPSTTDLAQLLLMEFALVYANDWFVVPFRNPAGTLARVEGLAVTNNFGERFWVTAAGTGPQDDWHRWAMFQIASVDETADTSVLVPPATSRTLDGDPLEEVEIARDEVANMVWAVERTISSPTGRGRSGRDEARETLAYHQQLVAATNPTPPAYTAPISYLAMTTVPEHWIPFVPVHVPASVREIQLQRGRMIRVIQGAPEPPPKVPPRTTLVRQGLDGPSPKPYFVHEEEVPRSGALLTLRFRRTRWLGGEAPVWLGVRKQTGRGERGSGLAFDAITNAGAGRST